MIAVEYHDWDGPRDQQNKIIPRPAILLHVGTGRVVGDHNLANAAWIVVTQMGHDGGSCRNGEKIIKVVGVERITVKGVLIPFEPAGVK